MLCYEYSSWLTEVTTPIRGIHVPYGITVAYMPPGRGDIPAFTPAESGTRFSDPGAVLVGWLGQRTVMVYPPEDGHPSK